MLFDLPRFFPDLVTVEVLAQGADRPCRVRLTLPDGSGAVGELGLDARRAAGISVTDAARPEFGQTLFAALFPEPLARLYLAARRAAGSRGLRLTLALDPAAPWLHRLPWEALQHPQGASWTPLTTAPDVVFARRLETGQAWGLARPVGPLRVLVAISSPFPPDNPRYVDVAVERAAIEAVLNGFGAQVAYEVLAGAITAAQLAAALNQPEGYDTLYYVGHGDWRAAATDDGGGEGYLILAQTYGDGSVGPVGVAAAELGRLFLALPRLPQLIVLSACQSGQQSTVAAFAGVGPQLVAAGCPALICMQAPVEMEVARQFATAFFGTLLASGCVDLAVNRARADLLERRYGQWVVPVLYLRLADGFLFDPHGRFRPAERAPYKFLAPYGRDDQDLFKGRAAGVEEVCRSVGNYAMTLVYGETGVGVTSLLEAGVGQRLATEGWFPVSVRAYDDLAGEFRLAFQAAAQAGGRPTTLRAAGDAPLAVVLAAAAAARPERLVVILDQFEGVLILSLAAQQALASELEAALSALGERLRLILALHADVLGELYTFQPLLNRCAGPWIEIGSLSLEDAVQAMVDPLEILDWPVTLDPRLAREQIIPDLSSLFAPDTARDGTWIDPGQLQITCTWLYRAARNRRPPLIDEALYAHEGGGADGILTRYMEEELQTRFADQAALARQALVALAAPEQDHWATPDQVLAHCPGPAPDVGDLVVVLDRLARAEMVTRRRLDGGICYAFANQAIADEARRLGGTATEQLYNARDELERAWRLWLAAQAGGSPESLRTDRALATRQQLRLLADTGVGTDARPVKLLLLLRAAVLRGEPPTIWLEALQAKEAESGLIAALEGFAAGGTHPLGAAARELSGRLLGSGRPDLPAQPAAAGCGLVAWTAAAGVDPVDRETAALALIVLPGGAAAAFPRLTAALDALPPRTRRGARHAAAWGALQDLPGAAGVAARQFSRAFAPGPRLGIYLWRVHRRLGRQRWQIAALAFGSGIGGGLGLALERLLVGALAQSPLATVLFALFSYWGLILMMFTSLGMSVGAALRLDGQDDAARSLWLAVLGGGIGFGMANLVVAILNGIDLTRAGLTIPWGLAAGGAAAWALAGSTVGWRRALRVGIGAAIFGLVQAVFLARPAWGSGLAIALSAGFFQVEFDHFQIAAWQAWIASQGAWFEILALGEALAAGLALLGGAALGRQVGEAVYQRNRTRQERQGN